MAVLYITEYATAGRIAGSSIPVASAPPIVQNNVVIGGGSLASNVFNNRTQLIRVHADAICSIKIGVAVTATTADSRMAANQTEYYFVGTGQQIAVISNS